jgi:60 kDa SS-A/Ro ribonucleoprotein
MPVPELIGNLGKLSSAGALTPRDGLPLALSILKDSDRIKKAGVHPLAILFALKAYAKGRDEKGTLTWESAPEIIDALNAAFAKASATAEPAGKRILFALDISDSMAASGIAGTSLSPMEAGAAMALITAATEKDAHILGFTAADSPDGSQRAALTPLSLTSGMRLDQAMRAMSGLAFGDTDCALPMLHALQHDLAVDAFVVYTDSDTMPGKIHPVRALREYRSRTRIPAKLVVVGMASSGFSIADPNDGGMLDVAGFDAAAPELIADFIRA